MQIPLITDIKRSSSEDGPGLRSVVFFKGCPLRCVFCQNPETQRTDLEIFFTAGDCIKCGACVKACPRGAIDLDHPARILREHCDLCSKCIEVCPGQGLRLVGQRWSIEELTEYLLRDKTYYYHSGGGVTLSGGECTLFPEYVSGLVQRLKAHQIHLALQTSGYFQLDLFSELILPNLDLIYFDFKLVDSREHQKFTGRPNEKILNNFRSLIKDNCVEVSPRIPLIPGVTATTANIRGIIDFLLDAGAREITLLPYNPMGLDKYKGLGLPIPDLPHKFMNPDEEKMLVDSVKQYICARNG